MRRSRAVPPEGAFAVVMATAIVARAVHAPLPLVSRGLVWASVAGLVAVSFLLAAARPRRSTWWDAATFAAAAVATGAGLAADGRRTAGLVLAAAGLAGWACLVAVPTPWRASRSDAEGASGRRLLAVVATQSAVIAAVALARAWHTGALAGVAVAVWLAGIAVYAAMIAPVVRGMVARAGASVFRADDWIATGALAISALAGAELLRMPGMPAHPAVRVVAVAVWCAAWLWVPTLVRLDIRAALAGGRRLPGPDRWSMVFPLGMLCAASQALGAEAGIPALTRLGRAGAWVALAAWVAFAAGLLAAQGSRRYSRGGRRSGFAARRAAASPPSPAAEAPAAASSRSSSARSG